MRVIRDRPRTVDLEEFLARPLFAHLATSSAEGPRDSPVWFLWDGAAAWIIGDRTDTFPGRVEREPLCALGVVDFDLASGRVHHVGMRGRATVEPWDRERARAILGKYIGPDVEAWDERFRQTLRDPTDQVLVRFEPDTVVARDQSYEVERR
jgi:hypothetical protein